MRPSELSSAELDRWRHIQRGERALDRPFFTPEYFRILEEVQEGIEVSVLEGEDGPAGFFPFQRVGARVARPAGAPLTDFQGWIAPADLRWSPSEVLDASGLSAWHFDHWIGSQARGGAPAASLSDSPYAEIGEGFEEYLGARRASGAGWVTQVPRKGRKLGREVGPLRFELETEDPEVLPTLRRWKADQRRRTGTVDPLDHSWALRAVERCAAARDPAFSGRLSALYAGDRLVAAHLGVSTERTLHIWFPGYDPELTRYSPGMVMLLELLRSAAEAGVTRVDFGKGEERYKTSLRTGSETVGEGCLDTRVLGRWVTGAWYAGKQWIRNSPLRGLVRGPKRRIRRIVHSLRGRAS